jgi:hypothetical protein
MCEEGTPEKSQLKRILKVIKHLGGEIVHRRNIETKLMDTM